MIYTAPKPYIDYIRKPFKKRNFYALKNVNINIQSGDRVGIIGENGAGKTTLLKLIGGLLYPTHGNVIIDGVDTQKNNLKARKTVGYVLNEERSFYWRLTGNQNLRFFGSLDNLFGEMFEKRKDNLLRLVGLEEHGDKLFANYSSGMKQKLAIARGLISNPRILILDEPTRTLDPISAEEVKKILLTDIQGNTDNILLIASHRLEEVRDICNKVCFMKSGKIIKYDHIENVLSEHSDLYNAYKTILNK